MSLTSSLKSVFETRIIRVAFLSTAVVTWIIGSSGALSMEKFEDVTAKVGLADIANVISDRSATWGDLDNDGHLDLLVGNFSHANPIQDRPMFFRNQGVAGSFHFENMSAKAGLHWQESYASPSLGDFDNDGFVDLYLTTVYTAESYARSSNDNSVLYRNNGNWSFSDVTDSMGVGISTRGNYMAAWADYDNDGDLDLLSGGKLLRNPGNANHWLKIKLIGNTNTGGRSAFGSQVRIQLENQVLTRQVESGVGLGNQNDITIHFGLGKHEGPVDVEIRWLNGARQTLMTDVDRLVDSTGETVISHMFGGGLKKYVPFDW